MQASGEFYASASNLPEAEQQLVAAMEKTMRAWVENSELEIPRIPTIISEAMKLANDPKATLTEIEQLVIKDQAISGKLIQTANSPLLRGIRDCATIREAITRIGQQELRMTLFGMFVQTRLFRSQTYGELMTQLWKHSLAAGSIARLLAEKLGQDPDEAFLAGFLHDVGMPILLATLTSKQKEREVLNSRVAELAMQRVHELAGEAMCKEWNMPKTVIEAVTCHHHFLKATENLEMAAIVQISSALTYRFGLGFSPEWLARYVSQYQDYLPLRDSYRAALAIDTENYPPLEMFETKNQDLLAFVEQQVPRLREELDNPFVSPARVKPVIHKATSEATTKPNNAGLLWVGLGIAAATVAGLFLWWVKFAG
jgi:putative nucleotidyltransferase with HDIG domain